MSRCIPIDDAHQATLVSIALRRLSVSAEIAQHPAKAAALRTLIERASSAALAEQPSTASIAAVRADVPSRRFRLVPMDGADRLAAGYAVLGLSEAQTLADAAAQVGQLIGQTVPRAQPLEHLAEAGFHVFHSPAGLH